MSRCDEGGDARASRPPDPPPDPPLRPPARLPLSFDTASAVAATMAVLPPNAPSGRNSRGAAAEQQPPTPPRPPRLRLSVLRRAPPLSHWPSTKKGCGCEPLPPGSSPPPDGPAAVEEGGLERPAARGRASDLLSGVTPAATGFWMEASSNEKKLMMIDDD